MGVEIARLPPREKALDQTLDRRALDDIGIDDAIGAIIGAHREETAPQLHRHFVHCVERLARRSRTKIGPAAL